MSAKLTKSGNSYTVEVATETEQVAMLDEHKRHITDEETGEPLFETKIVKSIKTVVEVDFNIIKRAFSKLTAIKGGKNELDLIGAGEHILMFGGNKEDEGFKKITSDPMLKASACMALAEIVGELEIATLKKN